MQCLCYISVSPLFPFVFDAPGNKVITREWKHMLLRIPAGRIINMRVCQILSVTFKDTSGISAVVYGREVPIIMHRFILAMELHNTSDGNHYFTATPSRL